MNALMQANDIRTVAPLGSPNEAVLVCMVAADGAPGSVLAVNDAACEKLGYSRDEFIGRTPLDRVAAHRLSTTLEMLARSWQTAGISVEARLVTRQGREFPAEITSHRFTLDGAQVALSAVYDISERKQMEDHLVRTYRLEMAGRLAGRLADDLTHILAPVVAYPDLVKAELAVDSPTVRYCDAMREVAGRMADIATDLTALARRDRLEQQPTDLNRVAREAMEQMPALPESLAIELQLDPEVGMVLGSPARLRRAVANLLFNAREAMDDEGVLTIGTENVRIDERQGRLDRIAAGDYVRLQVRDTGCGIPLEIRTRVFDPFFTTKSRSKRRGCGLGLSIVQIVVEDHRGYVELQSELGAGTTVSMFLPRSAGPGITV